MMDKHFHHIQGLHGYTDAELPKYGDRGTQGNKIPPISLLPTVGEDAYQLYWKSAILKTVQSNQFLSFITVFCTMSHWVASDNRVKTHPVVGKRLVSVILSVPLPLGSTRDGSAMQLRSKWTCGPLTPFLWRRDGYQMFLRILLQMVQKSVENTQNFGISENQHWSTNSKEMRSPTHSENTRHK